MPLAILDDFLSDLFLPLSGKSISYTWKSTHWHLSGNIKNGSKGQGAGLDVWSVGHDLGIA